jgi:hypothetical protein
MQRRAASIEQLRFPFESSSERCFNVTLSPNLQVRTLLLILKVRTIHLRMICASAACDRKHRASL